MGLFNTQDWDKMVNILQANCWKGILFIETAFLFFILTFEMCFDGYKYQQINIDLGNAAKQTANHYLNS